MNIYSLYYGLIVAFSKKQNRQSVVLYPGLESSWVGVSRALNTDRPVQRTGRQRIVLTDLDTLETMPY
jgi:hypothetical protein